MTEDNEICRRHGRRSRHRRAPGRIFRNEIDIRSLYYLVAIPALHRIEIARRHGADDRRQHLRQHRRAGPVRAPSLCADAGDAGLPHSWPQEQDPDLWTGCWWRWACPPVLYLVVFRFEIADRPGLWSSSDIIMSALGMVALMVAVYRSLGLPLVIIASLFLALAFFGGYSAWIGSITNYGGASFTKAMGHYWMQTEGVFGRRAGCLHHHDLSVRSFRVFAGKSGRRELVHQGGHLTAGRAARRACESRCVVVDDDRYDFRLIHREHS